MNKDDRSIIDTDDAWDSGELGRDEAFVQVAAALDGATIDDSLGLQPISIRLERSLIEDFKMIAELHGLGYQPLMRQALKRFAESEKKRILREMVAQRAEEKAQQARTEGTHIGKQKKIA